MQKFNFPKSARLLKPYEFRTVAKYGYSLSGKFLFIQVCENKKSSLKLGLTVSRKFGKATRRNRFKRLVREAFRQIQHSLPLYVHLHVRPSQKFSDELNLEAVKEELALCQSLQSIA